MKIDTSLSAVNVIYHSDFCVYLYTTIYILSGFFIYFCLFVSSMFYIPTRWCW